MHPFKRFSNAFMALSLLFATTVPAADLDFNKAVTIGSGPKTVVEFTDPDCPYCRKASAYFDRRSDITRHVFFYPLPRHPKAKQKVQFVLSQPDKATAYHQVMSGKLDGAQNLDITAQGAKLQAEQMEIAKNANVHSTPTFMISGRVILGLDVKKIEEVLGK